MVGKNIINIFLREDFSHVLLRYGYACISLSGELAKFCKIDRKVVAQDDKVEISICLCT